MRLALDERSAAEAVCLSVATLPRYRREGTGPRYIRIGGTNGPVRYRPQDIEAWLEAQTVANRAEELSRR